MDTFSPEFARDWLSGVTEPLPESARPTNGDDGSGAMREALEALVERVAAARCIV